jgi:hypothetical protein
VAAFLAYLAADQHEPWWVYGDLGDTALPAGVASTWQRLLADEPDPAVRADAQDRPAGYLEAVKLWMPTGDAEDDPPPDPPAVAA